MKTVYATLLFTLFITNPAISQYFELENGGYYEPGHTQCLSHEKRQEIKEMLKQSIHELRENNVLPEPNRNAFVSFGFPLQQAPGFNDPGFYGISNFVDHNPIFSQVSNNWVEDYNCGNRSYDISGYNHSGTDYFLWPFDWTKVNQNAVQVIAAASGTIIAKFDGNFDMNCSFNNDDWNAVYVQHSDGSVTWYGHMKSGSLTSKNVGAFVSKGEYLGVVASSGSSTGPHLHFEVYDPNDNLIDPYAGSCNSLNAISWWDFQRPYYDSKINKVMTNFAVPVFNDCPNPATINESNQFFPGNTVYFTAYYQDQLANQISQCVIRRPNGSVFDSWNASSTVPHYSASWWWWSRFIPSNEQQGTWSFEITYEGQFYSHDFQVGTGGSNCSTPTGLAEQSAGYSNVVLEWNSVAGATAYQTRQRVLGSSTWNDGGWFPNTSVVWANMTPCTTYEFQVRADCGSSFSNYSNTLIVSTQGCGDDYCYSYGISWDYWIEGVTFSNISNPSNNGYGYTNFTNLVADVEQGQDYSISLNPGTDVASTSAYWRVWIDLNGDADFSDSGEQVLSVTGTTSALEIANISIPSSASIGLTRMRVALGTDGYPTLCETGGIIDVEDYGINITGASCSTPTGLAEQSAGYSNVVLEWNSVAGATAYQTRQRVLGSSTWNDGGWFPNTSVVWANMTPCTTYEFQVRADCGASLSDYSSTLVVSTQGCGDDYCYSYGLSWDYWIEGVTFSNISNPSNNGYGYTNFTNLVADVEQGQDYSISLNPGTDVASTSAYWRVWIDLNGDADFSDSGEQVLSVTGTTSALEIANISIPSSASIGLTRMRVALGTDGYPTLCETGGIIDVEDYGINITGASCSTPTGLAEQSAGYSNVVLEWNSVAGATAYQTRQRVLGSSTWNDGGWFPNTSVVWANMTPCTTYEFQVRADCGASLSDYSSTLVVSTQGCGDDYCYSYGLSWDYWIEGVTFSNISNPSNNGYGYTNFTNLVADVEQGQDYSISLDPGTDVASTSAYWRVWIDLNGDADFSDSGEQVLSVTGTTSALEIANISIPSSASIGLTRMRVALGTDGYPTLCETGGIIDVEDYGINITGASCSTPTGLAEQSAGYSNVVLEWNSVAGATAYQTRQRVLGSSTWNDGGWFPNTSVVWANMTPCTTYEFQVRADCGASLSDYSSTLVVSTQGCGDDYCYSYGLSWDYWISRVALTSLDNTSGNGYGYTNFTNLSANVIQGGSYTLNLESDDNNSSTSVYWRIWIDFNQDGDFNDPNEEVASLSSISSSATNTSISIPLDAQAGTTRMRVSMSPIDFSSPCDINGSLDVEDYSISIATPNNYLTVTPDVILFPINGGSEAVQVSSNTNWEVYLGDSWLSVSPLQGTNDGTLIIDCSPNPGQNTRSGAVIVQTVDGSIVRTIDIEQEGEVACNVPSSLSAQDITPTTATLQWSTVNNANFYTLEIRAIGNSNWLSFTLTENEAHITGLAPCQEYEYRVQSNCNDSFSSIQNLLTTGCGPYCISYGARTIKVSNQ